MAPDRRRALRLAGLGLGALFLLWLPTEDVTPTAALLLAAAVLAWAALAVALRRAAPPARWLWLGAAAGLATPPLAAGLLVFKSGLHAHGFSDFGPQALLALLGGVPAWGLVGATAGALAGWLGGRRSLTGEERRKIEGMED